MEEEFEKIIKKFIEDNLEIEIEHEHQYYQDYPDTKVKLILCGKIISEDWV